MIEFIQNRLKFLILLNIFILNLAIAHSENVKEIIITGNKRISKETILMFSDVSKNKNIPDKAPGSAEGKVKDLQIHLLNRKVDYHIEQDSNELVIKIRDGETGEVIRQIPEEEFLRLSNRISVFNKGILDQTV